MLPTQGQGTSQTVEDAEALGAFFDDIALKPLLEVIEKRLREKMNYRHARASLIQRHSREAANPATNQSSSVVRMRPDEFMEYNCMYRGAKEWYQRPTQVKV
ncbi:hypothetical protein LTR53_007134 [Teratosphaeriaceae sp. CCFEE 6253]|nr:hypothetical protein LTR53_007134 [Teratosphaeriaceae sp. CCFEE 6253]